MGICLLWGRCGKGLSWWPDQVRVEMIVDASPSRYGLYGFKLLLSESAIRAALCSIKTGHV